MTFTDWLTNGRGPSHKLASRRKTVAPRLECLEDRVVLSMLTVTNNLDSGPGSLRAEIAAAQHDTIVFAPSLHGQTITLTSGDLLLKKDLTIAGPSDRGLTISGNNASQVFEVANMGNVTLSGLTISNEGERHCQLRHADCQQQHPVRHHLFRGRRHRQRGHADGQRQHPVRQCRHQRRRHLQLGNAGRSTPPASCRATPPTTYGGGIWYYPNGATVAVSGSTLSGNVATNGGGIYNEGTLTVVAGTLSGNTAGFNGGGIYSQGGALTISGSTLSGNVASNGGGGILNIGILTVKKSCTITGNTAPIGYGADFYNQRVLYLDSSSTIGILDGNPAVRI